MVDGEGSGIVKKTGDIPKVADVDIFLDRMLVVIVKAIVQRIGVDGQTDYQDRNNISHGILSLSARKRSVPMRFISILRVRLVSS